MQYQFNERYEYVKTIEFVNSSPLVNVEKIRFFKEEEITGTFLKKEFRYSFDNSIWTNWITLSQSNVSSIKFNNKLNFWIQFRYTRDGILSGNIKRFYLFYDSNTPTPPAPIPDSSTDADTLGGELPSYYLNRNNFIGAYSTIQLENIIGDFSTLGLYYTRIDSSLGTTFRFKGLKGNNGISIIDDNGKLIIDGNEILLDLDYNLNIVDASIEHLKHSLFSTDSSIIRIDSNINYLYNEIDARDTSIDELYQKDLIQDTSILYLNNYIINIDSSLEQIYVYQNIQDSSIDRIDSNINNIFNNLTIIDSSIEDLNYKNNIIDASIERIDSDINDLQIKDNIIDSSIVRIDIDVSTLKYTTDNSIERIDSDINDLQIKDNIIDASIERIDSDISTLKYTTDASIERIDSDIITLKYTTDVSIERIDSDINDLQIKDNIIDASIERIDSNINDLQIKDNIIDSSIVRIDIDVSTLQYIIDSSIEDIYYDISTLKYTTDASIERIDSDINDLQIKDSIIDSSIERIDSDISTLKYITDASINQIKLDISTLKYTTDDSIERIDSDINDLQIKDNIIDASIERIDSDINDLQYNVDSSINDVYTDISTLQYITDSSIEDIYYDISILKYVTDASIKRIDSKINWVRNIIDASIQRIDSDINDLQIKDNIIDSSIERIDINLDSIEASIALIRDDEVINIGEGSIGVYSSRDLSYNILLKSIDQIGPVVITQDSSTILIDSSIVKIYDSSLNNNVYTAYDLGGIEASTSMESLKGDTYTNIIDYLLFPTVEPSIIYPYSVFEISGGRLFEVDQNISPYFTTTFYPGNITVGDVFQNYSTGNPNKYYFKGYGHTETIYTDNSFYSEQVHIDLEIGYHYYTSWVDYDSGPLAYDNKGNSYGFIPDGSTNSNTIIIESTFPIYANSNNVAIMTKSPLKSMITGNNIILEFAPEVGGKNTFDIATYWINSSFNNRPIKGIQTYMPFGDDWEYQGGTPSNSLLYWDISSTTHRDIKNNYDIDYTRYIYNGDDRGRTKIKLIF